MKKKILIGNWKMNKTIKETVVFVRDLDESINEKDLENLLIGIAPSFLSLPVLERLSNKIIGVAQNFYEEEKGAYTGEVSALMLKEIEIEYSLVGHSERRKFFNESNNTCNLKLKLLEKYDIGAIYCVGENIDQYDKGETKSVIKKQIGEGLKGLSKEFIENLIIAYEPVWAIGSGKSADENIAEEIASYIKEVIEKDFKIKNLENIKILYGGSVNPSNVSDYVSQPHIDGVLVGGSSLSVESFKEMINKLKG